VLITTKRGEKGDIKVTFSANYGSSDLWRTPQRTNKEQYKELAENALSNGTGKDFFTFIGNKSAIENKVIYYDYGVEDWTKYICKTGINQKYNLQVSGGNDKNIFLISGTWANDQGVFLTSKSNRASLRLNMDNKLNRFMTLKSDMSISTNEVRMIKENDLFTAIMNASPASTYYDAGRIYFGHDTANHATYEKVIKNEELVAWNPYSYLLRHNNTEKTNQYKGDFDLETKISKDVVNHTRVGYSMDFWASSDFWANDGSQYEWNGINAGGNGASNLTIEKKAKYKWQAEDIITFSKEIQKHNILMLSGISLEGYTENWIKSYAGGAPGTDNSSNALDANYLGVYANGNNTGWKTVGIPVRFDYNYNHKYFFQANCRADASSKFMPEKRWGFFPSLSVGWTISEEQFMQIFKTWLTQFKVRANWGKSGNNRIDDFSAYTIISTGNNQTAVYGRSPMVYSQGWSPVTYGNPSISWEKTTGNNIGIDWSVLRGSISGAFDVFSKTTTDMLLKLPLPLSFGTIKDWQQQDITPWQNAGSVNNTGYEITLAYKKAIKDFSFEIRGNYSHVANKITKLGEQGNPVLGSYYDANGIKQTYLTYSSVGNPISMFYGWKIDRTKPGHPNGIWQTSDATADGYIPITAGALPKGSSRVLRGDFIFTDMNGDGVIDEQDKTFLGSPFPKATYGLNLNLRYKNIELTAFFQGVYGNKILNTMRYYSYSWHGNSTAPDLLSRSWQKGVNENTAEFPINTDGIHDNNNYRLSDFYIEDGSYLRLKNLEISYNVPNKWIKKMKIKHLRVAIASNNLMTWTKYTGFDPEIGGDNISMGIDKGTYPQSRTYSGSISIDF
jgi:TonB-linked SusC/RagA family outer membrane protein